jgi:hypothetical protein
VTVQEAIRMSDCDMAERRSSRTTNRPIAMFLGQGKVRIIKSFTDPTVVRKLRPADLNAKDWVPLYRKDLGGVRQ